jgi:hypothetical protein
LLKKCLKLGQSYVLNPLAVKQEAGASADFRKNPIEQAGAGISVGPKSLFVVIAPRVSARRRQQKDRDSYSGKPGLL